MATFCHIGLLVVFAVAIQCQLLPPARQGSLPGIPPVGRQVGKIR